MLRLLIPALRADLQMIETYEYVEERPLEVDILALGGTEDPAVSEAQLADWARYTTRDCEVRLLPGGHFFLFQGSSAQSATAAAQSADATPALQIITRRLERCLTAASDS
jgi:surfactin synthase thioesterase subunit